YLLLLNSPVPTQASALSLHDALPISELGVGDEERAFVQPTAPAASAHFAVLRRGVEERRAVRCRYYAIGRDAEEERVIEPYGLRSEEHTSELQSRFDLVCRLLLEKKK